MPDSAHYVEVNEAMVWATRLGVDWWNIYRLRFEALDGRIEAVTHSLGGDRIRVACDDGAHAAWLANHMVEVGGMPKRAVRARQAAERAEANGDGLEAVG